MLFIILIFASHVWLNTINFGLFDCRTTHRKRKIGCRDKEAITIIWWSHFKPHTWAAVYRSDIRWKQTHFAPSAYAFLLTAFQSAISPFWPSITRFYKSIYTRNLHIYGGINILGSCRIRWFDIGFYVGLIFSLVLLLLPLFRPFHSPFLGGVSNILLSVCAANIFLRHRTLSKLVITPVYNSI